ncbi:hypothetical protein [Streptomyces sp. NPDC050121]|uniref:hypothetical protein n=1 Tax=Streptomyces sp. NPDC050121 TaxID=3365601 RepID=UPI0037A7BC9A
MVNPLELLLGIAVLVVVTVGHSVFVILPRLVWTPLRAVWRTFGRAPHVVPDPGGEPAVPVYVRSIAPRDLRAAWWDGLVGQRHPVGEAGQFLRPDVRRGRGCILLFLRPAFLLATVAVVLTAAALSILPLLFSLLFWALCGALWTLWWAVWAALAGLGRVLRGPAPCPHTDCGRVIDRPVRLCLTCGAAHHRLAPDRYGALYRRCWCGTRLPAVIGVRRLAARCPHCAKPLPAGYDRARVVVLVGSPAAQRGGVYRQGLAELGATPGSEPPLVRADGRSLLLFDPPGDAYGSQESVAVLDVLRQADGLLLVVDDPAVHSAAVHAVTRVLHVVAALPARRRPRRLALLHTRAARGDDTAVRAELAAAGGGHLLRALDATGIPLRCVPASVLAGTLWWLAGDGGLPGPGASITPPPVRRPENALLRFPRHRVARRTLLLTHLAGYLVIPLVLVLLVADEVPSDAVFGVPGAYDKWRHPLRGSVRQVDLMAATTWDWPKLGAGYSAPGHPPSAALPGHPGYWSIKGSPRDYNWLRVDFGLPLPLSEVTVDFDPDSVKRFFPPSLSVDGQVGTRAVPAPFEYAHYKDEDGQFSGLDFPFATTVDSLRIGISPLVEGGDEKQFRMREFNVRWISSDALRLHPADGGRLGIENVTGRSLAIDVRAPLLPAGWHATLVGHPPRVLGAHDTYEARWRITAPQGTSGRAPIAYAVDATEDGHTVTSRCLALLTAAGRTRPLC